MKELKDQFNNMQYCVVHTNCSCHCSDVCKVVSIDDQGEVLRCSSDGFIFKGVIDMWQKMVCAKPKFQKWHALQCVKGKC
jgi:hypothetical protein